MRLHNYTPHPLVFRTPDGEELLLPSLGVARCREVHVSDGFFDADQTLPRTIIRYEDVTGLPEPELDVLYLVSQLVVSALPERDDIAYPAGLVRDEDGNVIGFTLLGRLA